MPLYAAYGTNMDPEQMAVRAPHSPLWGAGWLSGWRLTFGGEDLSWDGARATVVEERFHQVFVVLYDVPRWEEPALDRWEGVDLGLRRRHRVRVSALEGDVLAWLYVMNGYEGGLPSATYLAVLADAAEKAGAPNDYVKDLRTRPCRSLGD